MNRHRRKPPPKPASGQSVDQLRELYAPRPDTGNQRAANPIIEVDELTRRIEALEERKP